MLYRDRAERDAVLPDVLHMIGNTPLIRLDKIARSEGLKCELCELWLSLVVPNFSQHCCIYLLLLLQSLSVSSSTLGAP